MVHKKKEEKKVVGLGFDASGSGEWSRGWKR